MSEADEVQAVAEAIEHAFRPLLEPLGFRLAASSSGGVRFSGSRGAVDAKFVPRDGDVQVRVEPADGGASISLLLYLRAVGSPVASRLGDAVATSPAAAIAQVPAYAAGLRDAVQLLQGDTAEIEWARTLRWWNTADPPRRLR